MTFHRGMLEFSIEVSLDNSMWTEVVDAELAAPEGSCLDHPKLFSLGSVTDAHFVRMVVKSFFGLSPALQYFAPVWNSEHLEIV